MKKHKSNSIQRHIEFFGYKLFTPLRLIVESVMSHFNVMFFYRVIGSSYGDTLAISAIIDHFSRQKPIKAIVFSKVPALFIANPHVILHINYNSLPRLVRSVLKSIAKYFRGKRVVCVGQEKWVLGTDPKEGYKVNGNVGRYLSNMIPDWLQKGVLISNNITPKIYFTRQELEAYQKKYAWLPAKFAAIKASVGKGRVPSMILKEWGGDKMNAVANHPALQAIHWVQIGEKGEPIILGAEDVTGISIRESLYIISRAQFVLTTEGFISHAAAALDVPAVVVFSGRPNLDVLVYSSTIPVVANDLPDCAPCWSDYCYLSEKVCTERITVQQVVDVIQQKLVKNN